MDRGLGLWAPTALLVLAPCAQAVHRRGLIRLAQSAGVLPGYFGGLSRSRLLCLQLTSRITPALAWRFASKELA